MNMGWTRMLRDRNALLDFISLPIFITHLLVYCVVPARNRIWMHPQRLFIPQSNLPIHQDYTVLYVCVCNKRISVAGLVTNLSDLQKWVYVVEIDHWLIFLHVVHHPGATDVIKCFLKHTINGDGEFYTLIRTMWQRRSKYTKIHSPPGKRQRRYCEEAGPLEWQSGEPLRQPGASRCRRRFPLLMERRHRKTIARPTKKRKREKEWLSKI